MGEYVDRGRVEHGSIEEMLLGATRAYVTDTLAGRSTLLVVGTNDAATAALRAVRRDLQALGVVRRTPVARLRDGSAVALGDVRPT